MRTIPIPLRCLTVVLMLMLAGSATADAFEAHNFIAPAFGTFPGGLQGLAVDLRSGNIYADGGEAENVQVLASEGGAPAGGGPASFTGAGNPTKSFRNLNGVAVDNACAVRGISGSECSSFDPADGDVYVYDSGHAAVDRYRLNASDEYEYICQFKEYTAGGDRCVAGDVFGNLGERGLTVDSAGDVYVLAGSSHGGIVEFNSAGEGVQALGRAFGPQGQDEAYAGLAVASDGTIYTISFDTALGVSEVLELKRASLTGPVEGEPTTLSGTEHATAVAFDLASDQLYVDFGSYVEAFDSAHEVVSRFGSGIVAKSEALAINEVTGEIYVANGAEDKIDRFGPGLPATTPIVDEPPPSASAVTRTTALISGTIDAENATTSWYLEYVPADEYQPVSVSPYAAGGRTAALALRASTLGEGIGPLALTGLLAGTTYDYRLVASNAVGTTYGADQTFATAPATPPVVTTGTAGEVTQTSATLTGVVEPRGLQTSYEFEVGTDTSYGGAKLFGNAGVSAGLEPVSTALQYLIPGTTYHYRLVATNEDGTSYGQDATFTTPGVPAPIVQPPTTVLIASPTVRFPSTTGAITKGQGAGKSHKTKRKAKHRAKARSKQRRKKKR